MLLCGWWNEKRGRELSNAGHMVYYFSFEMFREKIESAGACFISCDGYDFEMEDKENSGGVADARSFIETFDKHVRILK